MARFRFGFFGFLLRGLSVCTKRIAQAPVLEENSGRLRGQRHLAHRARACCKDRCCHWQEGHQHPSDPGQVRRKSNSAAKALFLLLPTGIPCCSLPDQTCRFSLGLRKRQELSACTRAVQTVTQVYTVNTAGEVLLKCPTCVWFQGFEVEN